MIFDFSGFSSLCVCFPFVFVIICVFIHNSFFFLVKAQQQETQQLLQQQSIKQLQQGQQQQLEQKPFVESDITTLCRQFSDLGIYPFGVAIGAQPNIHSQMPIEANAKGIPKGYLCHICFTRNHLIRDCPLVRSSLILEKIQHQIHSFGLLVDKVFACISICWDIRSPAESQYLHTYSFFTTRLVRGLMVKHLIKVRSAALANTSAQNVSEDGCQAIRGQILPKIVSNAMWKFIHTSRYEILGKTVF